jgi:hypothetical protein
MNGREARRMEASAIESETEPPPIDAFLDQFAHRPAIKPGEADPWCDAHPVEVILADRCRRLEEALREIAFPDNREVAFLDEASEIARTARTALTGHDTRGEGQ